MSFVEQISNNWAKWLAKHMPNTKYPTVEDQIEVYTYGWMLPIGAVYKGVMLIALSIILGILMSDITNALLSVLFVTCTFSSLRIIAGGSHLQTYNRCMVVSITQFIITALLALYTLQYWSFVSMWLLFNFCAVVAIYNIVKYIPRDTPNNLITEPLIRAKFKRWSSYYLCIWIFIMIILLLFNVKLIFISSCFGLLLELFSISRMGYGIYEKIDSILAQKQM